MTTQTSTVPDAPVILVHGNDEYLVSSNAKRIVEAACPPDRQALGLEILEAEGDDDEDVARVISAAAEALQTVGLFGGEKCVWLRDLNLSAESIKRTRTKAALDHLTGIVKAGLPAEVKLVVSSARADARSGFVKAVKKGGAVEEFSAPDKPWQQGPHAEEVVRRVIRQRGLEVEPGLEPALVARVGTETRLLHNEIEKLALYAGDRPITHADMEAVTVPTREAIGFEWTDAIGKRDLPGSLALLRRLEDQGEPPQRLLMMMERTVSQLLILRECQARQWLRITGGGRREELQWNLPPEGEQLFENLDSRLDPRSLHPYRALLLAKKAASFGVRELAHMQTRLLETHEMVHSSPMDPFSLLEILLIELLSGARNRKAPAR